MAVLIKINTIFINEKYNVISASLMKIKQQLSKSRPSG